jgi:hypothetical protein
MIVESFFSPLKHGADLVDNWNDLMRSLKLQKRLGAWIHGYDTRDFRHSTNVIAAQLTTSSSSSPTVNATPGRP